MAKCLLVIIMLAVIYQVKCCPVVNCGTTSPVFEGEQSQIICYFVHDPRPEKKDFRIYICADPTSAERPKMVLDCYYREKNSSNPDCKTADGYIFNGEYGTTVTLDIPKTTQGNDGHFVCQTTSTGFKKKRVCGLHVKSKGPDAPKCVVKERFVVDEPSSVTCLFPEELNVNSKNVYVEHTDILNDGTVSPLKKQILYCSPNTNCVAAEGYRVLGAVQENLTITIPILKEIHFGKYACKVYQGDDEIQSQDCFLGLSQGHSSSAENKKEGDMPYHWIIIILLMLVIVGLIFYIVYSGCNKKRALSIDLCRRANRGTIPTHQTDQGRDDEANGNGHAEPLVQQPTGQVSNDQVVQKDMTTQL